MKAPKEGDAIDLSLLYPMWYLSHSVLCTIKPDDFHHVHSRLRADAQEEVDETSFWLAPLLVNYLAIACMGELRHGVNIPEIQDTNMLQTWGLIETPTKKAMPPKKPSVPAEPLKPPLYEDDCGSECPSCTANKELYEKKLKDYKKNNAGAADVLEAWESKIAEWHVTEDVPTDGFNYAEYVAKHSSTKPILKFSSRKDAQKFAPMDELFQGPFFASAMGAFGKNGWSSSYGGKKWADIAEAGYIYRNGSFWRTSTTKDAWGENICRSTIHKEIFLDRCAQLRHNGGVMFDKRTDLLYWNNEKATAEPLLDLKRDARDAADFCHKLRKNWNLERDPRLHRWIKRVEAILVYNSPKLVASVGQGLKFEPITAPLEPDDVQDKPEEDLSTCRAA